MTLFCPTIVSSSYLLQNGPLLLGGQAQVPLLAGAELGCLLVKFLLALFNCAYLFFPECFQRNNKVVISSLKHPVSLVLDSADQPPELLEAASDHQLVICLVGPDAVELEVDQVLGEASLGSRKILRRADQIFHFLNQLLDILTCPLQLLLMAVQTVPEIKRKF